MRTYRTPEVGIVSVDENRVREGDEVDPRVVERVLGEYETVYEDGSLPCGGSIEIPRVRRREPEGFAGPPCL
jgi:hypothetical protein